MDGLTMFKKLKSENLLENTVFKLHSQHFECRIQVSEHINHKDIFDKNSSRGLKIEEISMREHKLNKVYPEDYNVYKCYDNDDSDPNHQFSFRKTANNFNSKVEWFKFLHMHVERLDKLFKVLRSSKDEYHFQSKVISEMNNIYFVLEEKEIFYNTSVQARNCAKDWKTYVSSVIEGTYNSMQKIMLEMQIENIKE